MQISRIGVTSFGSNPSAEKIKRAEFFLSLNTEAKLNHLHGMLETAADERKVLAQNQAKMFEMMKRGFGILANHCDNTYTCSRVMNDTFENVKIKQL